MASSIATHRVYSQGTIAVGTEMNANLGLLIIDVVRRAIAGENRSIRNYDTTQLERCSDAGAAWTEITANAPRFISPYSAPSGPSQSEPSWSRK